MGALDDLEASLRMRRRGRAKERAIAAGCLFLLAALAAGVWALWRARDGG